MKKEAKYVQFPLFMLRDLITDKERAISNIFKYGIYNFSKKIDTGLIEIARQLMYVYYRRRDDLTIELLKLIEYYIKSEKIFIDEDYNGFSGDTFDPEMEIEDIIKLFGIDEDFKNLSIEFVKVKKAYEFLKITGNFEHTIKYANKVSKIIPEKEPYPMVNVKLLFEFRDNEKTEFDLAQLASYLAIRSIKGQKSYCKTNKKMIICRMFGYSSIKNLPETIEPNINCLFDKYSKRYHIDKLLQYLEMNWNIITYSHNMRGLYVSTSEFGFDKLAHIAEKRKLKNKLQIIKQKKKEATIKAFKQLYK